MLIGSALTEDDGEAPNGNFGILEAPSREAAQAFAESDPYALAGLVESIEGRMERAGGRAAIVTSPGSGTEVELHLPRGTS